MTEKLKLLFKKRSKIKKELEILSEEKKDFDKLSKRFNKISIKFLLISVGLMMPMGLYTIPIIPKTYYFAGETMTNLTPLLPHTTPVRLLLIPAIIGGVSFMTTSATLTIGNILYFIPIKKIYKIAENNAKRKKRKINKIIIRENNKINSTLNNKKETSQPENNYSYNITKDQKKENNNYSYIISNEDISKEKNTNKIYQLKKNKY